MDIFIKMCLNVGCVEVQLRTHLSAHLSPAQRVKVCVGCVMTREKVCFPSVSCWSHAPVTADPKASTDFC